MVTKVSVLRLSLLLDLLIASLGQVYKNIGGPGCCDCEVTYCVAESCDNYRTKCLSTSEEDCSQPAGYAIEYQGNTTLPCQQECDLHPNCVGFATKMIPDGQTNTNTSCLVYASTSIDPPPWEVLNESLAPIDVRWFYGTGGHDITFGKVYSIINGQISHEGKECFKKARCNSTSDCDSLLGVGYVCREHLCASSATTTTVPQVSTDTTSSVAASSSETTTSVEATTTTLETSTHTTSKIDTTSSETKGNAEATTTIPGTSTDTTSIFDTTNSEATSVGTTLTLSVTPATATLAIETIMGSLTFKSSTLTQSAIETSVRKSLAQEFGVSESQVEVTVVESRRLSASVDARMLAGNWEVTFRIVVPSSDASAARNKASAIGLDPTSFNQAMKTQLLALGVSAVDAAIEVSSFQLVQNSATTTSSLNSTRPATSCSCTVFLSVFIALSSMPWLSL